MWKIIYNYQMQHADKLWKLCEQVPDSVKTILICNFMRKITYSERASERARENKPKKNHPKERVNIKRNIKCLSGERVGAARSTYKRTFALLIVAHFSSTIVVYSFYRALDQRNSRPVSFEASLSAFLSRSFSLRFERIHFVSVSLLLLLFVFERWRQWWWWWWANNVCCTLHICSACRWCSSAPFHI